MSSSGATGWVIGTDVGGTFTDLWLTSPDGESLVCKSPTTADVVTGVLDAVDLAAEMTNQTTEELCRKVSTFRHGTTVGLNALLTGRSARTALITTAGFGDVLEIGRLRRGTADLQGMELGDYALRGRSRPLVPRELVIEVEERIDAGGSVIRPLDAGSLDAAIARLRYLEVEAVAVCLLWSVENPEHEVRIGERIVQELPNVFVTLSHEVAPAVGEYARASTAAANAALGPIAGRYLDTLAGELRDRGMAAAVMMTTSAGGVVPASEVGTSPVIGLLSGPAACVVAGQSLGARLGLSKVLTMDVGGTSFDVGVVVDGAPLLTEDVSFGGADMRIPSVDIASIGAGGGSIAAVDGGVLTVGPRSAGAVPGPVCYGKGGTEPTTTDADLVLGVLSPDRFSSGGIRLDRAAAAAVIGEKVGVPLGIGTVEAARAIRVVFDAAMSDLLRSVTIERGHDPREFTLIAGGGSGPSHAWALCRETGMPGFLVPSTATAQSAYGAGTSELKTTASRNSYVRLPSGVHPGDAHAEVITAAVADTTRRVVAAMPDGDNAAVGHTLAMRYAGQVHHLDIAVASSVSADELAGAMDVFDQEYEALFGRGSAFREAGYELLSVRSVASQPSENVDVASDGDELVLVGARAVVFDDAEAPVQTPVYEVKRPYEGQRVAGPALIELPGCVIVVPPGGSATTITHGIIDVRVGEGL